MFVFWTTGAVLVVLTEWLHFRHL